MKVIKKIVTHLAPHLDELFAEKLMKKFGTSFVHVLSSVQHEEICVAVEDVNSISKNNPSWLCLGIGGGPFDDHGSKSKKSASLLVAEYLGIEHDPRLLVLLELVTRHDKEKSSSSDQFTLPRAINFMHRYGYESKAIREWVEKGLDGLIDSEALLLEEIKGEISKMASREAFQAELKERFLGRERKWEHFNLTEISKTLGEEGGDWLKFAESTFEKQRLAFRQALKVSEQSVERIQTKFGPVRILSIDASHGKHQDYEIEFDSCSRHMKVRADLVIVRNSLGHTLVAANNNFRGNLAGFVKNLRTTEAAKRGLDLPEQFLIVEGSIPLEGLTSWYVHEGIGYRRIYNGTTTRPIVDLSELSFDEIKDLLVEWLEVSKFTAIPLKKKGSVSMKEAFKKAADAS